MLRKVVKKYWMVALGMLAVALLYGGGHVFQIRKLGWNWYEPTTIASDFDAAATYYPRAKSVFEGDRIVGDINLAEYAEGPAWMPMLNPLVMGNFAKLVGSMKMGVIVSDFLFPPIIFLLFYWFINLLTHRRLLSFVAASFFIFGPGLPFWEFSRSFVPPIFSTPFDRIDWPKATMPFYLLAIIFTYLALTRKKDLIIGFAGIFAGVLFYTYLYDWVSFYTGLGLLLMWFLFTRRRVHAKIVGLIIAIGLAVSVGYWTNFFELTSLPQYQDIVTRVGVERSHALRFYPWWLYLRVGAVIGLLYYFTSLRGAKSDEAIVRGEEIATLPSVARYDGGKLSVIFLTAFLLSIFATLNLQVITGINPQPDHWARSLFPFLYGALVIIVLGIHERYLKRISLRVWTAGGILLIVLLFSVEVLYILKVGERGKRHDMFKGANVARTQNLIPEYGTASYQWMRKNLPAEVVVAALSPSTNLDLQLYTTNTLFLPYGLNTIAPNEEIWQRFFYLVKLYNVPEPRLRGLFVDDSEMGLYLFHNAFFDDKLNSYFKPNRQIVPAEILQEKISRYADIDSAQPPFKFEYVYFGPNERALGAEDPIVKNSQLVKVYADEEVKIYKL